MSRKLLTWNEFKERYGTSKTTNFDLIHWARGLGIINFRYAMRDELKPKNIIMNLDSSRGAGIHHVAIFNTPEYKNYFSSFGDPPPPEVVAMLDRTMTSDTIREYNDFQVQEFNTSYCGQAALYFLYCLNNGKKACDIILELKDV